MVCGMGITYRSVFTIQLLCYRFKLWLDPTSMPEKLKRGALPRLPFGKSVEHLYGEFLKYLMCCAEKFIKDAHPTVRNAWPALRNNAAFVLAHPNSWGGVQQAKLRHAAIIAGLIPDSQEGRSRVHFVTEGEASLHYCVRGDFLDTVSTIFLCVIKLFSLSMTGGNELCYRRPRRWHP